jgi:hypothetical protein
MFWPSIAILALAIWGERETIGGGERSVAADVGEVIAAHAVMFLEMADDGLNGGTPCELALDLRREAALLAAHVDLGLHAPARLK